MRRGPLVKPGLERRELKLRVGSGSENEFVEPLLGSSKLAVPVSHECLQRVVAGTHADAH